MLDEHYKVVYRVLEVFAEYKLFLCPKKYKFNRLYIKYISLVILENQVEIDFIKMAEVCN